MLICFFGKAIGQSSEVYFLFSDKSGRYSCQRYSRIGMGFSLSKKSIGAGRIVPQESINE